MLIVEFHICCKNTFMNKITISVPNIGQCITLFQLKNSLIKTIHNMLPGYINTGQAKSSCHILKLTKKLKQLAYESGVLSQMLLMVKSFFKHLRHVVLIFLIISHDKFKFAKNTHNSSSYR